MSVVWRESALCPWCGASNDLYRGLTGKVVPQPGDWAACFTCGRLAFFTDDKGLRRATRWERREIERTREYQAFCEIWKKTR